MKHGLSTGAKPPKAIRRCIYCGNPETSREHVPTRCLLEKPFPPNLITVPSCLSCNQAFSLDEEYFLAVLSQIGTSHLLTNKIQEGGCVDRMLSRKPLLDDRITRSLKPSGNRVYLEPELERINRVIQKIATGLYYQRYGFPISLDQIQAMGVFPYNIEDKRPAGIILASHSEKFVSKRWHLIQRGVFRYQFVKSSLHAKRLICIMDFHQTLWGVVSVPIPSRSERRKQTKDFGTPNLI
jgi:hypothetical protein